MSVLANDIFKILKEKYGISVSRPTLSVYKKEKMIPEAEIKGDSRTTGVKAFYPEGTDKKIALVHYLKDSGYKKSEIKKYLNLISRGKTKLEADISNKLKSRIDITFKVNDSENELLGNAKFLNAIALMGAVEKGIKRPFKFYFFKDKNKIFIEYKKYSRGEKGRESKVSKDIYRVEIKDFNSFIDIYSNI